MYKHLIQFIQNLYSTKSEISLHEPSFDESDKELINSTIDSTFVSSVGPLVSSFEDEICNFTGSNYAVAVVNGTSALHISLELLNVGLGDEVLTQSLNFVASTNAINQCKAYPVFIDVSKETLGMCPISLSNFLHENCEMRGDACFNKISNRAVKACMPMHTFGFPCQVEELKEICDRYNIKLVEDSAESLGSYQNDIHTGISGEFGSLSFNGNKIITTGAGGMIITDNENLAYKAKHITTTAKMNHRWNFDHDMPAYNYRMPNLNASLGLTQIKKLPTFLNEKREIAREYKIWGDENNFNIFWEPQGSRSNFWLNTLIAKDKKERDIILEETNDALIMTRPAWTPMHLLPFNKSFQTVNLDNTIWLADRIVNLPSSVRKNAE